MRVESSVRSFGEGTRQRAGLPDLSIMQRLLIRVQLGRRRQCSQLEVFKVSHQVGIPGIVRNGVVVPQSNQPLPEGSHVEIRMEPGDVPEGLKSEIEAWDKASDESWKLIESLEASQQ
jgi:hypothetical protein